MRALMKRTLLVLALSLTACSTAQLDLPSDSLPVSGANPRRWNAPVSFGEWRTQSVNEGTSRSILSSLGIVDLGKADQAYRLTLNDVAVECHTREVVIGAAGFFIDANLGSEPLLVCGYEGGGKRSALALSRTGKTEPSLRGELREQDGPAFEVRSLHRAIGMRYPSGDPFGFEIVRDGKRVAAVETMNRGRVWIEPRAENRNMLAAAAASLLLFREPEVMD